MSFFGVVKNMFAFIGFLLIVTVVGIVGWLALSGKKPGLYAATPKYAAVTARLSGWSPPPNFTLTGTQNGVAYGFRWMEPTEFKCSLFHRCSAFEIVSSKDCLQGFTATVEELDASGVNVGALQGHAAIVTENEPTQIVLTLNAPQATQTRVVYSTCN